MARAFSSQEASRLIAEHRALKLGLEATGAEALRYRDDIKRAAQAVVNRQVTAILADVPVDELNRDKQGIRVKLLHDAGYHTVSDLAAAPIRTLAAIGGISEDGARLIKARVRQLAQQAAQGARIRLSADDRSEEMTRLIIAISGYRRVGPRAEQAKALLRPVSRQVDAALEDLTPATATLRWIFTPRATKARAEEAYAFLLRLSGSDYGQKGPVLIREINSVRNLTAEAAWKDFAANPIPFANLLEELTPGVLGADETVYGLPESLAEEIQAEPFYPEGLRCTLRRYQEWGVKYILHQKRVLLGDEMGLGKTVQAIAAMVSLRNTGATHFAVVCPASVIANWCREIEKHSDLSVVRIHGQTRLAALAQWVENGGVAVTTYETTGFFRLSEDFRFTLLVVDEAHYIKNPSAQRTGHVKDIGTHADQLLFMTGTALENRVDEMIALIRILRPEVANEVKSMAALSAAPRFQEKVAPVYYRRRREDVLTELPELIESQEWCTLTEEEEQIYEQAVLNKKYAEARRVSWSVPNVRTSSKAGRLAEIVEEAASEERKVIVFSFFLDTMGKVMDLFGERCVGPINGSVPPQRRQEIIDEFDAAPAGTVLCAQIQAGGTGLNIQSASVVVICEPQFKPSVENQAISRAYRMGQARNVLVYRLLCENTVEEKMIRRLEEKQQIFDAFADESVAAQESLELDERSFGSLMEEEARRIAAKHGESGETGKDPSADPEDPSKNGE